MSDDAMAVGAALARAADPGALRRTLARLGEVTVRETHGSTVFLVGDRAYKLRKPMNANGADLRTLGARFRAGARDLELGMALAPGIVIGTLSVVPSGDGEDYLLTPSAEAEAIDALVEMARYDEADTMRERLRRHTLTGAQARAVGAKMATFHRAAARVPGGVDYRAVLNRNVEALMRLAGDHLAPAQWFGLQRFAAAFLLGWAEVLRARAAAGTVIDAHGDLRTEHVLIEGSRVRVVDRPEFDVLRRCDVADELGTLLVDLADQGAPPEVAAAVLSGYSEAGGALPPDALVAFFGSYRAQVRARVALVRAAELADEPAASERAHALRLLALSQRLGWQARGPLLLLVTGPAAAGRSTLATALAEASGLRILSSDVVRGEGTTEPPDHSPEARYGVYAELAERAGDGRATIVDATFGDHEARRTFTEGLGAPRAETLLVIECTAPTADRTDRAARRSAPQTGAPDDRAEEAANQSRTFTSMDAHAGRLSIDTQAPIGLQVEAVASWLDSLLATGRAG
ncbi:MAG: AAA family ATPase [Solirubrobacteraceae bacterium]|nr:AAA family ATPase [Solirubrobacteraceae bacterium]